jgi:four helix bundle protein
MSFIMRRDKNNEARRTKGEGMTKSEDRNALDEDSGWGDGAGLVREEPEIKRVYDLEERTARFGEAVIDFAKTIPVTPVTNRIISQLVGAATSVGANYVEADDAVSKPRKLSGLKSIGTCRKEARETKHFLRTIVRVVPELKLEARTLLLEATRTSDLARTRLPSSFVLRHSLVIRHSDFVIFADDDAAAKGD